MSGMGSDSEEETLNRDVGTNSKGEVVVGMKRIPQESGFKHPLMCRACGKIFTDKSNCRRYEKTTYVIEKSLRTKSRRFKRTISYT